jgi:hydrogenase maturation protease
MGRRLIVGYGNPLRGDDGVGWHAAQHLLKRSAELDADVISCHQLTPELAEPVSRAERVIFIDARTGLAPGKVERCQVPRVSGHSAFSHDLDPSALVALAQALYGSAPDGWVLTVTGESFAHTDQLSPSVQNSLPELLRQVEALALQERPKPSIHEPPSGA